MKFRVEYSYGVEWHNGGEFESMFEAKQVMAKLKKHFRNWDGKLLGKVRIVKAF